MLLTLTAHADPPPTATGATAAVPLTDAADIGHLLHKHPDRVQAFTVSGGTAHVLYPEVSPARTTVALLLEVDGTRPAGRRDASSSRAAEAFGLGQYVSDRPYVASSLLAVAIGKVFSTAMAGRCASRPELAAAALDLELHVPAMPCRGGTGVVHRLFEPLGWEVEANPVPYDSTVPAWGDSDVAEVRLRGRRRLAEALTHLYVLLPVLDDGKHYWVGPDEVDKLLRAGAGWLADHPEAELITRRYLKHQRPLVADAATRLAELDGVGPAEADTDTTLEPTLDTPPARRSAPEPTRRSAPVPTRRSAAADRVDVIHTTLREIGARSVVDLGCGEGRLLEALLDDATVTRLLGVEVSSRELARAEKRLALERRSDTQRARISLLTGSVLYTDTRWAGYDAAVLSEVVEHVDPQRLGALEHAVFAAARPGCVIVTTPNADHNALFPALPAGHVRHPDHRFEWTREEFRAWADRVGAAHGYTARFTGAGADDAELGPSTQVAVLTRLS